jgi:uridine kinase
MKLVGVSGGSGSGKSTLGIALYKKYPNTFALIHIDDYFKSRKNAPILYGFANWDDPASVRFDDLYKDLIALKSGQTITIFTKSELYNPNYNPTFGNKIEYTIQPRSIIVLEGHLALSDQRIRDLMDLKIFLDISIEESIKRQSGNRFNFGKEYLDKVLIPMHKQFIEPTKKYADIILEISNKSAQEVISEIEPKILTL